MSGTNGSGNAPRLSPLHAFLSDAGNRAGFVSAASTPPDTVHRWLANLVLLTGVPFEYLVPDERMLPQESVRFFFLDANWIERLIDGALSVVLRTGLDQLITDALGTALRQPVKDSVAGSVRPRLLGTDPSSIEPEHLNWPLTGFLIRSIVVDHWKGIVIENTAQDPTKPPLPTLRLDRPAPGVLLGLYNGQLGSVTFKHPPESLHFGIDSQEGDDLSIWRQQLRSLDTGQLTGSAAEITFRNRDEKRRVIDVSATTNAMKAALAPPQFTSAEFAIQMIESPKSVTFEMLYPSL